MPSKWGAVIEKTRTSEGRRSAPTIGFVAKTPLSFTRPCYLTWTKGYRGRGRRVPVPGDSGPRRDKLPAVLSTYFLFGSWRGLFPPAHPAAGAVSRERGDILLLTPSVLLYASARGRMRLHVKGSPIVSGHLDSIRVSRLLNLNHTLTRYKTTPANATF